MASKTAHDASLPAEDIEEMLDVVDKATHALVDVRREGAAPHRRKSPAAGVRPAPAMTTQLTLRSRSAGSGVEVPAGKASRNNSPRETWVVTATWLPIHARRSRGVTRQC